MNDEKLVQNGAGAEPQDENSGTVRAMLGNITRLPASLVQLLLPLMAPVADCS